VFKGIILALLKKVTAGLSSLFFNIGISLVFAFLLIGLLIKSPVVYQYSDWALDGNSRNLEFILIGFTFIFSIISAWKLSRQIQERRLKRAIFSSTQYSDEALFLTDNHQQIISFSGAFQSLFEGLGLDLKVKRLEIINLHKTLDAKSKPIFIRIYQSAMARTQDEGELSFKGEGSIRRIFKLSTEPVVTLDGIMLWRAEDVTEQRVDDMNRLLEGKFIEDLLHQLPVGFFSADGEGKLRFMNSVLRDWLSIAEETVLSDLSGFMEFVSPDVTDGEVAATDASGMHGGLILKNAEGTSFPAYLIQSQKESVSGDFEYSRSIVLREPFTPLVDDGMGKALLRRLPWLFSDAPVGIVMLDIRGEVIDCNKAFLKLLGLHRDGVIGRPLSERISKEDSGDTDAQLSKVVMGIMPATLLDVRMPAGGERELTASLFVSSITDDEGEVVGLVIHVIDTTEQKNLEVQFNQAQKMQAVGQLAGGVAHDFNNLLTAMGGFCDLLLDRHGSDDPSFSDIMQIKQNTNRAGNLVRQLLAFSRRQTLQPKVIAITDALNDLSNLLRRLIGENITLELNHGIDVDLIRTDPGQFDQVIINLAVNARDAMPGGGVIDISTERVAVETSIQRGHEVMPAGEYILIKVVDTGSGIAKEDIGRIFEPFFSTKVVGEGTGLGLSTVYGIIRQSDGYIFVDSALGEGSTFSLYLPAFSAAEADYSGGGYINEVVDESDLTGGETVLLVEDEDAVRLFGARALRNKGYRVLEANDGEHALDVINEYGEPIDLILTDVMMPGMDGHTLVRLVLEELPEIKVILMSGYTEDAIPGEITSDASINFLSKPFSLQDLASKVKDVLTN